MGRQKHRERFVAPVGFDDGRHRDLRVELRGTTGNGQHHLAVVGCEQFIEYRAIDFFFGPGERQVGHARCADPDVLLRQVGDHLFRWRNDVQPVGAEPVDHAGGAAAGGGHHGDAMAGARLLLREQRRQLEQGFQHVHAQHALGPEKSVCHRVGAGHRAGVRGGHVLADFGAAELVDDDGLARGVGAATGAGKMPGIAYRFHEQQDGAGVQVVHQHVRQFADTDVGFVADGNQFGKTGAAAEPAREQAAGHAAALRHHGDGPRLDVGLLQHGVDRYREMGLAAEQADAVGADQAHAAGARDGDQFVLRVAARRSGFRKAVTVNGDDRDFFCHALLERCLDGARRHHDECMINVIGHSRDIGIGLVAEDFVTAGIDRENFSGVTEFVQIALRTRGVLLRVAGSADQRDRTWFEHGLD